MLTVLIHQWYLGPGPTNNDVIGSPSHKRRKASVEPVDQADPAS